MVYCGPVIPPSETCLCAMRRMIGPKSGGERIDQVDRIGDHRGGQCLRLIPPGDLIGHIEHPLEFGARLEHVRVEALGDLVAILGDDSGGGLDHGFGFGGTAALLLLRDGQSVDGQPINTEQQYKS